MNGYEANNLIKQQEQWKDLPIFALTGFGNGETIQKLKDEGFVGHFVKPAELERITVSIKEFFSKDENEELSFYAA